MIEEFEEEQNHEVPDKNISEEKKKFIGFQTLKMLEDALKKPT